MGAKIDDVLAHIAHRTHSPRGQQAATGQTYKQLLDRIPKEQRPIISKKKNIQHADLPRWSAAACLLLVIGIGLAIAGVWYHQHSAVSTAENSLPVSSINEEPRTLIYQNTPLADIAAELSAIFHTPIRIDNPALQNYCITATFCPEESLTEILSVLAEIGDFEVRKTSDGYIIEQNGLGESLQD